ncbi:6-carboxytetrahydropterin synthase QueD [Candidatus Aerophobetes bacterium]|nr:6-carboxytetrahydropterin synthase QueD [Candidatus Aerophobetes bacterium]
MVITREFEFDAAHKLVNYQGKCENLHGHRWKIQVSVQAPVGKDGIAFDFVQLKEIVEEKVMKKLDHSYLNDLLPQPSTENIAIWIWGRLKELPLYEIKVWESPTSFVAYKGAKQEV